jgi:hypothetical protein
MSLDPDISLALIKQETAEEPDATERALRVFRGSYYEEFEVIDEQLPVASLPESPEPLPVVLSSDQPAPPVVDSSAEPTPTEDIGPRTHTISTAMVPRNSDKEEFLKSIEIKPSEEAKYTDKELSKIRYRLSNLRHGACAAIPIRCTGNDCPMRTQCPLVEIGRPPLRQSCPVEINLLNEWRRLYIQEYDIDPGSFSELSMVNELAEVELLQWRINNSLAKAENAMLVTDNVVGVDKHGSVITRQEVSSFFDIRERLNNRKSRIIKLMVGDRQEKYKEQAATKTLRDTDPSSRAAELRTSLTEVMKLAKQVQKDLAVDAEVLTPEDIIGGGE